MSFILDALRRSEHERQRQTGPALVESPVAPPKARSNPWATAAIALLVVNLAAVGVLLLMRSGGEQAAAPAVSAAPAAPSPQTYAPAPQAKPQSTPQSTPLPSSAAPAATPPVAAAASSTPPGAALPPAARTPPMLSPAQPAPSMPGRNPLEREVVGDSPPLADEVAAHAAAPPPGPPAVVNAPTRGGTVVYQSLTDLDPVTSRPSSPPPSNLPTAEELTARGGLPELKLELHVYSAKPAERFVFVNGSRYREGDTTREGARVEEITRDGVVMSLRGNRFLLPRE